MGSVIIAIPKRKLRLLLLLFPHPVGSLQLKIALFCAAIVHSIQTRFRTVVGQAWNYTCQLSNCFHVGHQWEGFHQGKQGYCFQSWLRTWLTCNAFSNVARRNSSVSFTLIDIVAFANDGDDSLTVTVPLSLVGSLSNDHDALTLLYIPCPTLELAEERLKWIKDIALDHIWHSTYFQAFRSINFKVYWQQYIYLNKKIFKKILTLIENNVIIFHLIKPLRRHTVVFVQYSVTLYPKLWALFVIWLNVIMLLCCLT